MGNKKITAYKGFNKDLQCRDFQFEIGKEYEEPKAKACSCGFHACEYPLNIFEHYPPSNSRYCEVEQSGVIDNSKRDKTCSTKIKIGAEIGISGLVKAAIEYTRNKCTNECNAVPGKPATAGNRGAATAGNRGAATAGEYGAATAGEYGAATAGYAGAATAGEYGAATAGYAGAATAGEYGTATSRGNSSVGENGLAVARGCGVRVKGGKGAILVIAEESHNTNDIAYWKAVVVDGEIVKADTWYKLDNGNLIEAEQ